VCREGREEKRRKRCEDQVWVFRSGILYVEYYDVNLIQKYMRNKTQQGIIY